MVKIAENIIAFKNKHPKISDSAYSKPYAIIIGDVTIHAGASLWPGVVIRADDDQIEIGQNTILLDSVFIDSRPKLPVVIGEEVLISHQVTLHGCKVERGVVIGKNTNILEGSEIGEDSVITDGAYIKPNTQIPPRTKFSGALGRVVGQVTEDEIAQIRQRRAVILKKSREYGNWYVAKNL